MCEHWKEQCILQFFLWPLCATIVLYFIYRSPVPFHACMCMQTQSNPQYFCGLTLIPVSDKMTQGAAKCQLCPLHQQVLVKCIELNFWWKTWPHQLPTTTLYQTRCSSNTTTSPLAPCPSDHNPHPNTLGNRSLSLQPFPTSALAIHHYHPRGFPKRTCAAEWLRHVIKARSEKQSWMRQPQGGEWREGDKFVTALFLMVL